MIFTLCSIPQTTFNVIHNLSGLIHNIKFYFCLQKHSIFLFTAFPFLLISTALRKIKFMCVHDFPLHVKLKQKKIFIDFVFPQFFVLLMTKTKFLILVLWDSRAFFVEFQLNLRCLLNGRNKIVSNFCWLTALFAFFNYWTRFLAFKDFVWLNKLTNHSDWNLCSFSEITRPLQVYFID